MKKSFLILIALCLCFTLSAKNRFFLHNRIGALIKVDVVSGLVMKKPKLKGPAPQDVPKEMISQDYDKLTSTMKAKDKAIMDKYYIKSATDDKYMLTTKENDAEGLTAVRAVLMLYNKDNEMYTGVNESGMPMPHNFPRVIETKSQACIDIHFCWGVKFDSNVTLGFSMNLTNFLMPSLEFLVKYNFYLKNYPFEPYVGGVLYGGFFDGFPIGLDAIGGCDIYPMHYEKRADNRNFYLSGELRLGAVLYAPVYFDSGLDTEGIWKKLSVLAEGGFYFGYGYIFN